MAKSRAPTNWVFSIAFSLSIFSRIARRCRMASRLFIVVSLLMESAVIGLTDTGLLSEQFPLNILCPSTDCLRRPAKKRDQLTGYASSRELENTAAGQKASLQQNRVVRCKNKNRVWRSCSGVQFRKEC